MNTKQQHSVKQKLNEATTSKEEVKKEEKQKVKTDEVIQKMAEEVAHWKDLAMRTAAEMENLKKRTQIDIEKANRYATSGFAKDLLPVADCLEQALTCAKKELGNDKNPVLESLIKGVEMTQCNLTCALKKQQIEKMESMGKVFDPNLHNAVMHTEEEGVEENTITQVFQKGFKLGDKIVRFAMVQVAN